MSFNSFRILDASVAHDPLRKARTNNGNRTIARPLSFNGLHVPDSNIPVSQASSYRADGFARGDNGRPSRPSSPGEAAPWAVAPAGTVATATSGVSASAPKWFPSVASKSSRPAPFGRLAGRPGERVDGGGIRNTGVRPSTGHYAHDTLCAHATTHAGLSANDEPPGLPPVGTPGTGPTRRETLSSAGVEISNPHIVRLSPVGKTYVQYSVRGSPFVTKVSEVVPSRAEIADLRKDRAENSRLRARIEELEEKLESIQQSKLRKYADVFLGLGQRVLSGGGRILSGGNGRVGSGRSFSGGGLGLSGRFDSGRINSGGKNYSGCGGETPTSGGGSGVSRFGIGWPSTLAFDRSSLEKLGKDALIAKFESMWNEVNSLRQQVFDENSQQKIEALEDENAKLRLSSGGDAVAETLKQLVDRAGQGLLDLADGDALPLSRLRRRVGAVSEGLAANEVSDLAAHLERNHYHLFEVDRRDRDRGRVASGAPADDPVLRLTPEGKSHFKVVQARVKAVARLSAANLQKPNLLAAVANGQLQSAPAFDGQSSDNESGTGAAPSMRPGQWPANKPSCVSVQTQTDERGIVRDVDMEELAEEVGVIEDEEEKTPAASGRDNSEPPMHNECDGESDTETKGTPKVDLLGHIQTGMLVKKGLLKLSDGAGVVLELESKGISRTRDLHTDEDEDEDEYYHEDPNGHPDDGYQAPFMRSLHPEGPPEISLLHAMMDLRKSKASNWEKLRLEVTSGHWRNAFLGQFSSGNRQNLHRKLQLKNLSAANSSLVKYDRWKRDDERRVYTLRQTLQVCYEVIEKKAIQEQQLEDTDKVPASGYSVLPDFYEDFFFRKHGVGKLAKRELRRFVHSVKHYHKRDRRVELFGLLCGLVRPELYSVALVDLFMTLIKRLFSFEQGKLEAIVAVLKKYNPRTRRSNHAVSQTNAQRSVIGLDASVNNPLTWEAPQLLAISRLDPKFLKAEVVDAIDSYAERSRGHMQLDIDDAIFIPLDFFLLKALEAQQIIREQFYKLDADKSLTLSWEEFKSVGETMNTKAYRNGEMAPFSEDELLDIFKSANSYEDGNDDDELEDPVIAAITCYQAGMYYPNDGEVGASTFLVKAKQAEGRSKGRRATVFGAGVEDSGGEPSTTGPPRVVPRVVEPGQPASPAALKSLKKWRGMSGAASSSGNRSGSGSDDGAGQGGAAAVADLNPMAPPNKGPREKLKTRSLSVFGPPLPSAATAAPAPRRGSSSTGSGGSRRASLKEVARGASFRGGPK